MIFIITILISLIITSIFLALTWRKLSTFNFAVWIIPLAFCFLIIGVILMLHSANDISESLERQSWPALEAKVVNTDIIGERAYSPQLSCEYIVEGKVYTIITDLKTPGFGRKKTRRQTSEIILNEYPVGSKVQVRYNPSSPGEAYIRTGPYWSDYMKISLGVLLSLLSLYGLIGVLIKKFS